MNVLDWAKRKKDGKPITMVTCYDAWSAKILNQTQIDTLLIGDSVAMVMYGHNDTLAADVPMMARHTEAVKRGAPLKFLVADMPFLSFRKGLPVAMDAVEALMRAGAHAVKLEGVNGHEEIISHIVASGIPVMGHLGLTPQSIHQLGGFKVQGRKAQNRELILEQAKRLEDLGVFSLVLECVDEETAKLVTESLEIPTIGIGAGNVTDGQVLVLQDLLGANTDFHPKFVRRYMGMNQMMADAVNEFCEDVQKRDFPSREESYL